MPPITLSDKLQRILRRANPEVAHTIPTLIQNAHDMRMSDEELLNMICFKYHVGRDGWPLDVAERRRTRLLRFFQSNAPADLHKVDVLCAIGDMTDDQIMEQLYAKYQKDELGNSLDVNERLRVKLQNIFKCTSPESIPKIDSLLKQRQEYDVQEDKFLEMVCRDYGVGLDGWPSGAAERKRARLTRFYINNAPHELYKVDRLCASESTEDEVMQELYARYSKDEFGNPSKQKGALRDKLRRIFLAAAPERIGAVEGLLTLQVRQSLEDEDVVTIVKQQLQCDAEGWPLDPDARKRARITRFYMNNNPDELHKVEGLLALKDCTEDEVMQQLYAKYGKDELGMEVNNTQEDLKEKLYNFYEQYVPPEDVTQLVEQAMSLGLPEEVLMPLLADRYKDATATPNPLREKIRAIFERAAPDQLDQIPELMKYKRENEVSNDELLDAICSKFKVGKDGWPKKKELRKRARLERFFASNDPDRLVEVDAMLAEDKTEDALMAELFAEYGRDELGNGIAAVELAGLEDDGLEAEKQRIDFKSFTPGQTAVWPPPNPNTLDSLYSSTLFGNILRKYGGSRSEVVLEGVDDQFSRLTRRHPADDMLLRSMEGVEGWHPNLNEHDGSSTHHGSVRWNASPSGVGAPSTTAPNNDAAEGSVVGAGGASGVLPQGTKAGAPPPLASPITRDRILAVKIAESHAHEREAAQARKLADSAAGTDSVARREERIISSVGGDVATMARNIVRARADQRDVHTSAVTKPPSELRWIEDDTIVSHARSARDQHQRRAPEGPPSYPLEMLVAGGIRPLKPSPKRVQFL